VREIAPGDSRRRFEQHVDTGGGACRQQREHGRRDFVGRIGS
jgi:hypothetical protein